MTCINRLKATQISIPLTQYEISLSNLTEPCIDCQNGNDGITNRDICPEATRTFITISHYPADGDDVPVGGRGEFDACLGC